VQFDHEIRLAIFLEKFVVLKFAFKCCGFSDNMEEHNINEVAGYSEIAPNSVPLY